MPVTSEGLETGIPGHRKKVHNPGGDKPASWGPGGKDSKVFRGDESHDTICKNSPPRKKSKKSLCFEKTGV